MKVLVDEYVPFKLVRLLPGHAFTTARQRGWFQERQAVGSGGTGIRFVSHLRPQSGVSTKSQGRKIAILLLSTNHWPTLKEQVPLVQSALDKVRMSEFLPVEIPRIS